MQLNLPIHPSLRHPLTGAPLQAVFVDKHGRPRYPIMGGAPDDGGGDDAAAKAAADAKTAADAAAAKTAADKAAADKAAADAKTDRPKPGELGYFPPDTAKADMKPEERLAYDAFQSRKHEGRSREWHEAFGGKTAAQVKEELESLRREKLSDHEKAVEDAKKTGREEAVGEYAPKAVKTALKLLLGDMPDAEKEAEIELLDLRKFITESGDVDTDKVRRAAEKISPPAGTAGQQRLRNYGAGDRRTDKSSGVAAGRDLYKERRKTTSSTTTDS